MWLSGGYQCLVEDGFETPGDRCDELETPDRVFVAFHPKNRTQCDPERDKDVVETDYGGMDV